MISLNICIAGWCLRYTYVLLGLILVPLIIIPLLRKNFVSFRDRQEAEDHKRRSKYIKIFVIFTRILIFSLLIIAIATPYRVVERVVPGDTTIKILIDNSSSFQLFDYDVTELQEKLSKHIPVETKMIARGEKSALGDALVNNVGEDENILLISDGNANVGKPLGDMVLFAANLNASVSTLSLNPTKDDASLEIIGPSEIISGSEAEYKFKVRTAGSPSYELKVKLDGNTIEPDGDSIKIRPSTGYHRLEAKLIIEDYFSQNNEFFKTIKVIPRPNLLFVTQNPSPLLNNIKGVYNVNEVSSIPADLSTYHAVIINDLPASQIDPHIEKLSDYLIQQGNGLLVIGGRNSYDKGLYKNSLTETVLPVKAGKGKRKDAPDVSAVIVLDISGSSSSMLSTSSANSRIEFAKALAIAILSDFEPENKVGVVAFNEEAFVISPLASLSRSNATSQIARLQAGGGTFIEAGLAKAAAMLADSKGSKNIVLISDGITNNKYFVDQVAQSVAKTGIRIFAVGVGGGTDSSYMSNLASIGNGIYLQPDEHERLNLIFGPPEEQDSQFSSLIVNSKTHFITRNLQLATSITGFNYVVPKSSATSLITTDANHPIITAWRFGLGRVAALTTDDGSQWSGTLLKKKNFKLTSKTINWVIGDPGRSQEVDVKIKDVKLPKPLLIRVSSPEPPRAEGLNFYKLDKDVYGASIEQPPGFYDYLGATGAVNYPSEYLQLGMNPLLSNIVRATGGKTFNPDDIDGIVEHTKTVSKRSRIQSTIYRWPFIIAALIIFIIEIALRRVYENKSVIK